MQLSGKAGRIAIRNRLIANPRFRHWLARFPLTRGFSRRRVAAMFDINAGFVYSQIAAALVELDVLALLARGPVTSAEVAAHCALEQAAADRLIRAAVALQFAEAVGGRYMLGERGAVLHADPGISAMIAHHKHLYADLADPVVALRRGPGGGALQRYWGYAASDDPAAQGADAVAPYSALMASSQAMVAEQVVGAYRFDRHRRMLDVGGGEGVFARAVRNHAPALEVALFDLPAVAARAGDVASHGGDFFVDPLPPGFDLVTLVRIVHDHDDDKVMILLRNIAAAMPAGATLLIAEPMAATRNAEAMGDGYFGLYLWAMGSGRPRARAELTAMLEAAGFERIREMPTAVPLISRVIVAQRAGP